MFGFNKDKDGVVQTSNTLSHNSLVTGTSINGKINSETDIRIDGEVTGDVYCTAKLVLGAKGFIKGNIICKNALLGGKVNGNVKIKELLELQAGTQINGNVDATRLVVEDGASWTGRCNVGKHVTKDIEYVEKQPKKQQPVLQKEKAN